MKKNEEHTFILIVGIIIATCIALYRGLEFDLLTIIGIFFAGLMIFGTIVTLFKRW